MISAEPLRLLLALGVPAGDCDFLPEPPRILGDGILASDIHSTDMTLANAVAKSLGKPRTVITTVKIAAKSADLFRVHSSMDEIVGLVHL